MKIPRIIKSGVDEQREIDKLIREGEKSEEEVVEEKIEMKPRQLEIEIQKLWAQVRTLREFMRANDERFQRLSESIGDIRRRHITLEKELNSLDMRARRSIELVEAVQPQKLLEEVKKEDMKIMQIKAKVDANKKILDHLVNEIKDIRSSISAFKGTEAVMKLNRETMENLKDIKKIQARIYQNSEKVENIFVQVQKRYDKFLKLSNDFKALEKEFNEVMRRSNKFMVEVSNLATKDELNELRDEIKSQLKSLRDLGDEIKTRKREFDKIVDKIGSAIERIEELEEILRNKIIEIDDGISRLSEMEQRHYITREEFDKELDDLYGHILDELRRIENKGE
ncbi:MAG: hypothetical protein DRO95_06215 [Candidatus Altiarchaeales archaeon]|nr:MAG: hypothetical protein DRO95_06215 [Candidatus Altiarchaeales archaeon]